MHVAGQTCVFLQVTLQPYKHDLVDFMTELALQVIPEVRMSLA